MKVVAVSPCFTYEYTFISRYRRVSRGLDANSDFTSSAKRHYTRVNLVLGLKTREI